MKFSLFIMNADYQYEFWYDKYANRLKEPTVTTTSFYKNQIIRSSTKIEK